MHHGMRLRRYGYRLGVGGYTCHLARTTRSPRWWWCRCGSSTRCRLATGRGSRLLLCVGRLRSGDGRGSPGRRPRFAADRGEVTREFRCGLLAGRVVLAEKSGQRHGAPALRQTLWAAMAGRAVRGKKLRSVLSSVEVLALDRGRNSQSESEHSSRKAEYQHRPAPDVPRPRHSQRRTSARATYTQRTPRFHGLPKTAAIRRLHCRAIPVLF